MQGEEVTLKWVSFVELCMRIACIKYGTNDLVTRARTKTHARSLTQAHTRQAILAGRMHKEDRNLEDDDGESASIEGCLDKLMANWGPYMGIRPTAPSVINY